MRIQIILLIISLLGMMMTWLKPAICKKAELYFWMLALWIMPFIPQPHFWDFNLWIMWGVLTLLVGVALAAWAELSLSRAQGLVTMVFSPGPKPHRPSLSAKNETRLFFSSSPAFSALVELKVPLISPLPMVTPATFPPLILIVRGKFASKPEIPY